MVTKAALNWIDNREVAASSGKTFEKIDPSTGELLFNGARSDRSDLESALAVARPAQALWRETPAVRRGEILFGIAEALKHEQENIAKIVSLETGKSPKDALGETRGAIQQAYFMAAEGQRLYGQTLTSSVPYRQSVSIREPLGICGLIAAANTPVANIAWKIFPALICGNAAIFKSSEDTPATSLAVARTCADAGLPSGLLTVLQGLGPEIGNAIVESPSVEMISFTGSTGVGKKIYEKCAAQMKRVSLELGGKNAFVVCDDADLGNAVKWAALSAFSNAGQRCAAASRIFVFDSVFNEFKNELVKKTQTLKLGKSDGDDYGPVINERQLQSILDSIEGAKRSGAEILTGGKRSSQPGLERGFYIEPTLIEGAGLGDEISQKEIFGPVACLYRVKNLDEAIDCSNRSAYGLTSSIHTRSLERASEFSRKVQAGVVSVNAGTYGNEPHMPFGGVKASGNGTREPGLEAIALYSNLKLIHQNWKTS